MILTQYFGGRLSVFSNMSSFMTGVQLCTVPNYAVVGIKEHNNDELTQWLNYSKVFGGTLHCLSSLSVPFPPLLSLPLQPSP